MLPFACLLILNTHFEPTMFIEGVTKFQVPFLRRASNFSFIACLHAGDFSVAVKEVGSISSLSTKPPRVAVRARGVGYRMVSSWNVFGLWMWCLDLVTMPCGCAEIMGSAIVSGLISVKGGEIGELSTWGKCSIEEREGRLTGEGRLRLILVGRDTEEEWVDDDGEAEGTWVKGKDFSLKITCPAMYTQPDERWTHL